MNAPMATMSRWIASNLGVCPRCMRSAFVAAACASTIAFLLRWLLPTAAITVAMLIVAATLTALWLAHLASYSIRISRHALIQGKDPDHVVTLSGPPPIEGRRQFLALALKAFAFAVFATVLPRGMSKAQTACTVTSCSDPNCSCVAPTPKCAFCPNRSETGCVPADAVTCCSNDRFWYCMNGTQCNGDGTYTPYCR